MNSEGKYVLIRAIIFMKVMGKELFERWYGRIEDRVYLPCGGNKGNCAGRVLWIKNVDMD